MASKANLLNKRFGLLEIIGCEPKIGRKYGKWIYKCDCGKEGLTTTGRLNYGQRSCGCLRYTQMRNERGLSGLRTLQNQYKQNSKGRSLEFTLSEEEFKELTSNNCYYCGIAPEQVSVVSSRRTEFSREYSKYLYNGIDRLDNKIGYTKENSVSCCKFCNRAKFTLSTVEFQKWISRLISFNTRKMQ